MNEIEKIDNENVIELFDVEYISDFDNENIIPNSAISFVLDKIPSLAILASSLNNGETYRINIPKGIKGSLQGFNSRAGISGNIVGENSKLVGRASFTKVPFNTTELFIAAALKTIEEKLDKIVELQENILNFLVKDKETKIKGDMNTIFNIFNNLKFNLDNEKYINTNLIIIKDIKRASESNILFYEEQIKSEISKNKLIHINRDVNQKLLKFQNHFQYYKISHYLYSFSSFLEFMLFNNFDEEYLNSVKVDLEKHNLYYKNLYTKCYDYIDKFTNSSLESKISKIGSKFSKSLGESISKSELVKKTKVDSLLESTSVSLNRIDSERNNSILLFFVQNRDNGSSLFIEKIRKIGNIYNNPIQLYIDNEQVYLLEE